MQANQRRILEPRKGPPKQRDTQGHDRLGKAPGPDVYPRVWGSMVPKNLLVGVLARFHT
jgi:hypothetical protein